MRRNPTKSAVLIVCSLGLAFSFAPLVHAAQISFTTVPAHPVVGAPFQISVYLNTEADSPNVINGTISVPSDLRVEGVSAGGSGLALWAAEPHFVPSSGSVNFTGGVPGGVAPGSTILLFTIAVKANTPGSYTISAGPVTGFRNDGDGTAFRVSGVPYDFSVTIQPASTTPEMADTTAPRFVSVAVGKDPSLFNDQYYLTFFATDDRSGVSYYEVKEGWFGRYVRADRYYVLADQSRRSPLWIRAVDAAGNSSIKSLFPDSVDYVFLCGGGGIVVVAYLLLRYRYRRKRFNERHL